MDTVRSSAAAADNRKRFKRGLNDHFHVLSTGFDTSPPSEQEFESKNTGGGREGLEC